MSSFNPLTPADQTPQRGPNFCGFCDYWHPVASMVTGHVAKEHAALLPGADPSIRAQVGYLKAAEIKAGKLAAMHARKTARDAARRD